MTDSELRHLYFEWITQLVCDDLYLGGRSFNTLLEYLFERDFSAVLIMDDNRRKDGLDLRYRFSYENSYENSLVQVALQNKPCSVLEMMVALAQRVEEDIMYDPDYGNRTPLWFWVMVENLGLSCMDDEHFDELEFEKIIISFINRDYEPDGTGGLFILPGCPRDLRKVEIWSQACWFFDTIL